MLLNDRTKNASQTETNKTGPFGRGGSRRRKVCIATLALTAVTLLIATGAVIGVGAERYDVVGIVRDVNVRESAFNWWDSVGVDSEQITIDIKHTEYKKLEEWRRQALERGQITSDLKQYVPATIRHRDQQYKAKVRFKGEWTDHLGYNKWSFRVKLTDGKTLFGMKVFAIQHPRTRSYLYEWVYHEALKREDIVAQRYSFIGVTVNGRHEGIFALEEGFSKQLIESNQRRQGIMLRFNADARYHPFAHEVGLSDVDTVSGIADPSSSFVEVYDEDKLLEEPGLRDQLLVARNLLEAFRYGRLPTHQVFDVDKLATYFAVSELIGGTFAAYDWSDMRLFYNPVTSRLEPIGIEGSVHALTVATPICTELDGLERTFHRQLFDDAVFYRKYVAEIERVSQPEYLDELLADIGPELEKQRRLIHSEWPNQDCSVDVFWRNATALRQFLDPLHGLHAHLVSLDDGRCVLEIGAVQSMAMDVLKVEAHGMSYLPEAAVMIPGKETHEMIPYRKANFVADGTKPLAESEQQELKLHYRIAGTTTDRVVDIHPLPRLDESVLEAADLLRRDSNVSEFKFLQVDSVAKTITVKPGHHRIGHDIILPEGYMVLAGPGVELDFYDSAGLISYSPLELVGVEDQPVIIGSRDRTGQGVVVMKAGEKSLLQYVSFRGLSNPVHGGWQLTGAVTFNRSPVTFRNCEFLNNNSEDSLNLVQSPFHIDQCLFHGTTSDAFDGDFVTGVVSRSTFSDIGGDAVDVSGSQIEVSDIRVLKVADKAVSLGEASVATGHHITVDGAGIGIAVKDLSDGTFEDVKISRAKIGLAVFQKKPEFGGGRLQVGSLDLDQVESPYLPEKGSVLIVDDDEVFSEETNAKQQLYGSAAAISGK